MIDPRDANEVRGRQNMTIRYSRIWAIGFLGLGGINLFLAIWLSLLERRPAPILITGIVVTLIGFLWLVRPYAVVEQNQISVLATIGPLKRTFVFKTDADVKFEGNRLLINEFGQWKRVPLSRFLCDSSDWQALEMRFKRT